MLIFLFFDRFPVVFLRGPMFKTSRNSMNKLKRRRPGHTSPPLVNVEPNPGPYKRGRKEAKLDKENRRSKKHKPNLSDIDKGKIAMGLSGGMTLKSIAGEVKCDIGTVSRMKKKLASDP
jgi:hypothetical protein